MYLLFAFLFLIIFGVITLVFFLKMCECAYPYLFWGAIYVPTTKEKMEAMVGFFGENIQGETFADLGAGDGRLLVALAKKGAKAYGYEINPFLVKLARKNIKEAGVEDRAFIYCKNFWRQNLKDFDGIVVFGMKHMMKKLEKKFEKELKTGAKIVSNYFTLPTWEPEKSQDSVYLYVKK